jgi:hypothetical protein
MEENNPEAAAARLGLRCIGNSDYYEKPGEHGKAVIAYWKDGGFHKITEYAARNSLIPSAIYIASLDAVYLSCTDGQRLINRAGIILSAPGNFARINCCCQEGDALKKTALLNITDDSGNLNAAIVRDAGNGEYKWGLLFPQGTKGFVSIDGNGSSGSTLVQKGSDILFLETLTRAKAYSYMMPRLAKGSPEIIFLQKNNDYNRKAHEYEAWQNGKLAWSFDTDRVIEYVSFLFGHPWVAHFKCKGAEGLIDMKSREAILPMAYRKIQIEEGDFAYAISGNGHRCLYDIADRKWIVPENDGWPKSKKARNARLFYGAFKRKVKFYYKGRELKG